MANFRANIEEYEYVGMVSEEVRNLAPRLASVTIKAEDMGLTVFGGGTGGSLRYDDGNGKGETGGGWDTRGPVGRRRGREEGEDGLLRSE